MFIGLKTIRIIKNAVLATSTSVLLIFMSVAPDDLSGDKLNITVYSDFLVDAVLLFNAVMVPTYILLVILENKLNKEDIAEENKVEGI